MSARGPIHPIHQLVARIPPASDVLIFPRIPPTLMHEAVAACGSGPDHPMGETVLALFHYDFPERGKAQGSLAEYVVTDRRLFGRIKASNIPDTSFDLPYAHVGGVRFESGMLNTKLHVQLGPHAVTLPMWGKQLQGLFTGMQPIPPQHRAFAPDAPQPGPHDPTGALGVRARAVSGDPRIDVLTRVVHEAGVRGALGSAGLDLAARAQILDRGLGCGRGMNQGFWLSTLPPVALVSMLDALLGPATNRWQEPSGIGLELPVAGGGGGAAASTALGLALFATVGVGWISRARGPSLRGLRAIVAPKPCGSGFVLLGSSGGAFGSLAAFSPRLFDAVSQALFRIEPRMLLAQILTGPEQTLDALLGVPRPELEARAAALVGPADLGAFFPARKG